MRKIFLFIFFIFIFQPFAYGDDEMITGYVEVTQAQSLKDFLLTRIGLPEKLLTQEFLEETKSLNPDVKDIQNLTPGSFVYLEIPRGTDLHEKIELAVDPNMAMVEGSKKAREQKKEPYTLSAFYSISSGTFIESFEGAEITSTQDSPFTLGLQGLMDYKERQDIFLAGSVYAAYLDASLSNTNIKNEVPLEYGITSYVNWDREEWPVVVYGGADLERFSSFNIQEVANSEDIAIHTHHFLYAIVGLSKTFEFKKRKFLFKGSLGKTLWSNSDSGLDPFDGFKYILFLTSSIKGKWGAHVFLKQHFLSGPSDLMIIRAGAGASYTLF